MPAGGEDFARVHKVLGNSDIPLYNLPEKGVKALKVLRDYAKLVEEQQIYLVDLQIY